MGGWLHNPYRLGVPTDSGWGQNQKWPTTGPGGYITPAAWAIPIALVWGAKSELAHKWAGWLHNPCHLGCPQRFRAGGRITGGSKVGQLGK